jgi:hypothetical protein
MSISECLKNTIETKVNDLMTEVVKNYNDELVSILTTVSKNYNIKLEELLALAETRNKPKKEKKKEPEPEKKDEKKKEKEPEPEPVKKSVEKKEATTTTCIYEFSRPPNKGKICGVRTKGCDYCAKHKPKDQKEKIPTEVEPVKKSVEKASEEKKLVIVKNEDLNVWWEVSSGFVFKSATEKIVIGKVVDDTVMSLSSLDKEECTKRKIVYKETQKDVIERKESILKTIALTKQARTDMKKIKNALAIDSEEEDEKPKPKEKKKNPIEDEDLENMLNEMEESDDDN